MKIAFTTNICPHYRIKTFEILAEKYNTDFYFFSKGDDWFWQNNHGLSEGKFKHEYLKGFKVGRTRITPSLSKKLKKGNYDIFIKCINGRFALPVTYLVARIKRKPFILWTGIWNKIQTPFHRLFFPITRYIYRHSDAIVVYGEHVKHYLITEGVTSERIFIAPHAVDNDIHSKEISTPEKESLRKQLSIEPDKKVILFLGRLEEVKGLTYLIDAFADLNKDNSILVIAGQGSQQSILENHVKEKGIESSVRFTGYVSTGDSINYYAIADVFVLPSITLPSSKELWGLVINEAFNQGVPVITTTAVGAAAGGLVQNETNGLIIDERDSTQLAKALDRILSNPEFRNRLGHNARQTIATRNNQNMINGFSQAIEYVQKKKNK